MHGKEKAINTRRSGRTGKIEITNKKQKKEKAGCGDGKNRKSHLTSKALCKVTFRLPREAVKGADNATIVGDFNNWNVTEMPMKKLKNGDFTLTIELPCDREYSFRYLVNTKIWEKDWFADKNVPSASEDDNPVIS